MFDAPSIVLAGPIKIDEVYVTADRKATSATLGRARVVSMRDRGSYAEDKPPVFILADHDSDQRYIVPANSVTRSTVRLHLDNREEESLTVYTDGFRTYDPLKDGDNYQRKTVIHEEDEYVDGNAHGKPARATVARATSYSRRTEVSQKIS